MRHRYRPIRIQIPVCRRNHEHTSLCQADTRWEVDAIECIGTGLAIQKVWDHPPGGEDYGLVHIASGTLLLRQTVLTLVEAGMWLRKVTGVCDWTQPAHQLELQPETQAHVYRAWLATVDEHQALRKGKTVHTSELERA